MPGFPLAWPSVLPSASDLKILIVKPSSLGDVVQAMPVLRLLKRNLPAAQIYWWIEGSLAPLLQDDPDLAGVFIFDRKGWRTFAWWRDVWRTVQSVRRHRFDIVLDLQGLSRSAFFSWLADGKSVIGLDNDREGNREAAQIFYDTLASRSPPGTPAPERYLSVLESLGLPISWDFEWLPERAPAAATVRRQMLSPEASSYSWVMLLPGARWQNKRWPAELFADTVNRLAATNPSVRFAVLGVAGDAPLAEVICNQSPQTCVNLTGRTSIPEMIEWLRRADLVISNDTGPLHIAAALKRPVIAIYGPSDPLATGPHGQSDNVLQTRGLPCVPCMKQVCTYREPLACMRAITPEMVCSRAISVLSFAVSRRAQ